LKRGALKKMNFVGGFLTGREREGGGGRDRVLVASFK